MTPYQRGDKSKAICWSCEALVITTFALHDVPLSDGSRIAQGVLAAVCDQCGNVVAVSAQSTSAVVKAVRD